MHSLNSSVSHCNKPINSYNICKKEFSFSNIDENALIKSIILVKTDAIGLDNINLKFIRLIYPFIFSYILHIFNFILTSSEFPLLWKYAKVIPVRKIKNPKSVSDNIKPSKKLLLVRLTTLCQLIRCTTNINLDFVLIIQLQRHYIKYVMISE